MQNQPFISDPIFQSYKSKHKVGSFLSFISMQANISMTKPQTELDEANRTFPIEQGASGIHCHRPYAECKYSTGLLIGHPMSLSF